jgi:putative copper export protein
VGALMALAGVLFFLAWGDAAASGPRRLAMGLAVAAPLLLAGHLAAWLVNASPDHSLTSEWAGRALLSGPGRVEALRTALALLSLWALALARRPRMAALFAFAAVAVSGATGHSMAIHPFWSTPLKALHLAAVSVWMGGLLWLAASARESSERFASAAARVSSLALGAVLLVTVTGAAEALLFLPTPGEIFRSAYGFTTLAKIAGLGLLVLFGAYHKFRIVPRLAEESVARGFRGSLRTELGVMFAVVLLGGLLAYLPPSDEPTAEPPTALSDR